MEAAMSVFRNTRNESGFSPNQLFFLRNWRDHNLPDLRPEPVLEEMVKARDMVKGGCHKLKEDKSKAAWPRLFPGDMVRGQHTKTKEVSLKGEVLEMVHGDRAVNVDLDEGPRRSLRLANKKVTMGRLGTVYSPEVLPYYMAAV